MDPVGVRRQASSFEAGNLSADGALLRTPEAILQRLTQHFSSLLVSGADMSDTMLKELANLEAQLSPLAAGKARLTLLHRM
jgi:hypothetical protein